MRFISVFEKYYLYIKHRKKGDFGKLIIKVMQRSIIQGIKDLNEVELLYKDVIVEAQGVIDLAKRFLNEYKKGNMGMERYHQYMEALDVKNDKYLENAKRKLVKKIKKI